MIRICNLLTVTSPRVHSSLHAQRLRWADPDVTIEVRTISRGPYSLEFSSEEIVAGPFILEAVLEAERDGMNAVIVECMLDPVLRAARELVSIPVVGPAKAGLSFAITLGARIAIVSVTNGQSVIEEHVRAYDLDNHICCYRSVDVPPADLAEGKSYCLDEIYVEAQKAIDQDRADVVLLGCTAMSIFALELQHRLGIPVVEPSSCAIRLAIDLVKLGLSHSKRCYPFPPERPTAPGSISVWDPSGIRSNE